MTHTETRKVRADKDVLKMFMEKVNVRKEIVKIRAEIFQHFTVALFGDIFYEVISQRFQNGFNVKFCEK